MKSLLEELKEHQKTLENQKAQRLAGFSEQLTNLATDQTAMMDAMADIKRYTDQIAAAVYGEEVRGSIINALNKVNDDNNSYQDIKNEVVAARAKVEEAQNTLTTLNSANSTASTNILESE